MLISPHPDFDIIKPALQTSAEDYAASLALGIVGTATAVDAVLPAMLERGEGTLLFTTGSVALRPSADRASISVTTTAQILYLGLLAESLEGTGVRALHTTIVGPVGAGKDHEPATVAEHLWARFRGDETRSVLGG